MVTWLQHEFPLVPKKTKFTIIRHCSQGWELTGTSVPMHLAVYVQGQEAGHVVTEEDI